MSNSSEHALQVERLLAELSSDLGFSLPAREPVRFVESISHGVDAFIDLALSAEGLSPNSHAELRAQVRRIVARHFEAWADASA